MTVTSAGDPAAAFADLETQLGRFEWIGTVQGLISGLWGGVIWRYGLKHRRGLDGDDATFIASIVTLFVLLAAVGS